MSKTNIGLVAHAQKALKEKWYYGWGTYGQIATTELVERIIDDYPLMNAPSENYMLKGAASSSRISDCYGLLKSYVWWLSDTANPAYNSNGFLDRNTDSAFRSAKEKGALSDLPEIPGLILYMPGHVGVYCGAGRFIEIMGGGVGAYEGKIEKGVVTKGSKFKQWFKDSYIEYVKEEDDEVVERVIMKINGNDVAVNRILKDGRNFIQISELADQGLFDVEYNTNSKLVTIKSK